jgi:hypothetical protein
MRLNNTSNLDTETLRREFHKAARWAGISLVGTYVEVVNANYKRSNGRFYGADYVRRKGKSGRWLKWRKVEGYIRVYVKPARTLRDVILTFVHELSHLRDYRLKKEGKAIPPFREKRARRLAEQYGRVLDL